MKAVRNFTVIVLPDATMQELVEFGEMLKKPNLSPILTNLEIKIFKIRKGEMFEVVTSLKKIKGVLKWFLNMENNRVGKNEDI